MLHYYYHYYYYEVMECQHGRHALRSLIVTFMLHNSCTHTKHKEVELVYGSYFLVSSVSAQVVQVKCNDHFP
jgi:hypothetical protein